MGMLALVSPGREGAAANWAAAEGDAAVILSVVVVLRLPINSPLHLSLHF